MDFNLFQLVRELELPKPEGILQVGASYGQELESFLANGVTSGVFIEPLDAPFRFLAENCSKIPGFVAVQTLCSDETGKTYTFHVASNHGMSSSILPPANHLTQFDYVKFNETIEVVSNRLEDVIDFLEKNGHQQVTAKLDTLYMDTQGAELKVLHGAGNALRNIRYIFTEVTRNELYEGAPSLQELVSFLDAVGFTLNDVHFNKEQCGDAFFIRKSLLGLLV
jgi:FkbM family methyltransferase